MLKGLPDEWVVAKSGWSGDEFNWKRKIKSRESGFSQLLLQAVLGVLPWVEWGKMRCFKIAFSLSLLISKVKKTRSKINRIKSPCTKSFDRVKSNLKLFFINSRQAISHQASFSHCKIRSLHFHPSALAKWNPTSVRRASPPVKF